MLLHCVYTSRPQTDTQRDRGTDTADGWVVRSVGDEQPPLRLSFRLLSVPFDSVIHYFVGISMKKILKTKKRFSGEATVVDVLLVEPGTSRPGAMAPLQRPAALHWDTALGTSL